MRYYDDPNQMTCPWCNNVLNCIQDQLEGSVQSAFQSSQVILGLTPTLLSSIAPTVGEICMLSSNRPFLSILLSVGGPAVFCFRAMTYDDPLASLLPSRTFLTRTPMRRKGLGAKITRNVISLLEYMVALGAITNVVEASWMLGIQTIVSWKCEISFLPLTWTSLAMVVHLIASGSWLCSNTMRSMRVGHNQGETAHRFWQWTRSEFTLCAARERGGFLDGREQPASRLVVFANIFAQAGSFASVIYGTILLSSLLFIGVLDSFKYVIRYLLSALACRIVLMFELSGMIAVENEQDDKPKDTWDDESVEMSPASSSTFHPKRSLQAQSQRYQTL